MGDCKTRHKEFLMYGLVDCNNFYASCERMFRPDLNGVPIVVLSNNDGCVIARSNEAKALGIPMGAPAYKYKKEFQEKNIKVFSSNYALYGDMSSRVMNILKEHTPEVEVYSIDEAFLQLEGISDLKVFGEQVQRKVTKGTGIPVSIGIASTKALTKVANKIAKKYPERTKSTYVIDDEEKRVKALKWTKIGDVWGIGRQHANRLKKQGVNTAYDFTQLPSEWVRKQMSVVGLRLQRELKGIPTLGIEEVKNKKNIATTRSFEKNYTDIKDLEERVITFATSCGEKLRNQKSSCNALMVFLVTNEHRKDLAQYGGNIVVQLPYATNSMIDLAKSATSGLRRIYKKGYSYKKAGVIVMDIVPEHPDQLAMFEVRNEKHEPLMKTIDKINKGYGFQKVKLASQDLKRTWKMRQERLSPKYSTQLSDIITIKS